MIAAGENLYFPAIFVSRFDQADGKVVSYHASVLTANWTVPIPAYRFLENMKGFRQ